MFLCCTIIVAVVYLDQLSKWLSIILLRGGESHPLIADVLHLTYVENRGAAFGMLSDQRWLFMIASSVAIVGMLIYMFVTKPKNLLLRTSLSMIIGGGIGNMIDRLFLGYVVDFIDFTLINFAVFNIADSFVSVGTGLLMIYIIISTINDYKGAKSEKGKQLGKA